MLKLLWNATFGPQLYRRLRSSDAAGRPPATYNPNFLERQGGNLLLAWSFVYNLSILLSPILIPYMYRKGWFTFDFVSKLGLFVGSILIGGYGIRVLGRLGNPDYMEFLTILLATEAKNSAANKRALRRYDFEFWAWPTDYAWSDVVRGEKVRPPVTIDPLPMPNHPNPVVRLLQDGLSYFAAHTFGRRMLYPGSVGLMKKLLQPMLEQARAKMIEEHAGLRYKLKTQNGNEVDSMFFDRRNDMKNASGNTLVICCEGNAGYYEIGCTMTPLEGGYSILAWNHPGFGGSTNVPWPEHERAAIDVVVQFAINKLGFDDEQIVLLAWSIGGFSASWAAARYPAIGGLVLDATFDDLSPLAKSKMPRSWGPLVARTVRQYLDLPVARQLHFYQGPVQLIRRRKDEVIFTDEARPLATNRANHLLKHLFEQRYPKLFHEETETLLDRWLEAEEVERLTMRADFNAEDDLFYADLLRSYIEENGAEFPLNIGAQLPLEQQQALVLFLASRYTVDFDTTHCTPLPRDMFRPPRHPWELLID